MSVGVDRIARRVFQERVPHGTTGRDLVAEPDMNMPRPIPAAKRSDTGQ